MIAIRRTTADNGRQRQSARRDKVRRRRGMSRFQTHRNAFVRFSVLPARSESARSTLLAGPFTSSTVTAAALHQRYGAADHQYTLSGENPRSLDHIKPTGRVGSVPLTPGHQKDGTVNGLGLKAPRAGVGREVPAQKCAGVEATISAPQRESATAVPGNALVVEPVTRLHPGPNTLVSRMKISLRGKQQGCERNATNSQAHSLT